MKKYVGLKTGFSLMHQNHRDFLKQTEQFDNVLTRLRYEGKASLKKNIAAVEQVLQFYRQKMRPHIVVEEVFFGFVAKHVPKVQMAIRYLAAEHAEIMKYFKELELLIGKVSPRQSERRQAQLIEKLKDKGTFLTYLMRYHIQVEDDSIYQVALQELRPSEKEDLLKRMYRCPEWKKLAGQGF